MEKTIKIIGGGLAGCEAAWQLLKHNWHVCLYEQRPNITTGAHKTELLAELVCSNSFRGDDPYKNAIGLLHEEMRRVDSLILSVADHFKVPAGGALAVDRTLFSTQITNALLSHPHFTLIREKAPFPADDHPAIIATGPLTSSEMATAISQATGGQFSHFFDALAPIVYTESVDMNHAWYQSRYDKGDGTDYLNCPLTKDEYNAFYTALIGGEVVAFKEWENEKQAYFEGCLPIEVMASRGPRTLLFGPMKPTGLSNPFEGGRRPFAVLQLRKENTAGTLMNLVGFQTKLTYPEQKRIFSLIPALKNAQWARLGAIHRNTFIEGPKILTDKLSLRTHPHIKLAGQLTGCEGYIESACIGFLAGLFMACPDIVPPPVESAMGALLNHVVHSQSPHFEPMNINFGLFPPLPENVSDRKQALTTRARQAFDIWTRGI